MYRKFAYLVGEELVAGETATSFAISTFIDNFNYYVREYAGETQMLHRLAIILPNHNWLRYIQCTHQQTDKSRIRIDASGQNVSTQDATDPDNLDWQYEDEAGAGVTPNYAGVRVVSDQELSSFSPDSFPKIYLPAECDIPIASYGYWVDEGAVFMYYFPRGHQVRVGGENEPLTPCLVDMRVVGYGAVTPGDDGYPTADTPNNFFVDPFKIGALRQLTILPAGGVIADMSMPYSADAYLNDAWTTILSLGTTTGVVAVKGGGDTPQFTIDGVTYTVAVIDATYDVAADTSFAFTITDGTSTWTYRIKPSDTPWQTVGTPLTATEGTNRWGNLFSGSTLYANRSVYVAVNDWNLRLPDDLYKIKWVWKLPADAWHNELPVDATDDIVLTNVADNEIAYFNPKDFATHYFPLTEGAFTREKMRQLRGNIGYTIAGYYVQLSQQLRMVPRTTDAIAVYYVAKPDLIDNTLAIGDLPNNYVELPGIAVETIMYKLAWEYFVSAMGGDPVKAKEFQQEYYRSKAVMDKLYKGRGGQDMSAPMLKERFPSREAQRSKYFGSYELGEPQ